MFMASFKFSKIVTRKYFTIYHFKKFCSGDVSGTERRVTGYCDVKHSSEP